MEYEAATLDGSLGQKGLVTAFAGVKPAPDKDQSGKCTIPRVAGAGPKRLCFAGCRLWSTRHAQSSNEEICCRQGASRGLFRGENGLRGVGEPVWATVCTVQDRDGS